MRNAGELERENQARRDRLSRLSQASRRSNESRDFETVSCRWWWWDSARVIMDARYGSGQMENFVTSGMTPEQHESGPPCASGRRRNWRRPPSPTCGET